MSPMRETTVCIAPQYAPDWPWHPPSLACGVGVHPCCCRGFSVDANVITAHLVQQTACTARSYVVQRSS